MTFVKEVKTIYGSLWLMKADKTRYHPANVDFYDTPFLSVSTTILNPTLYYIIPRSLVLAAMVILDCAISPSYQYEIFLSVRRQHSEMKYPWLSHLHTYDVQHDLCLKFSPSVNFEPQSGEEPMDESEAMELDPSSTGKEPAAGGDVVEPLDKGSGGINDATLTPAVVDKSVLNDSSTAGCVVTQLTRDAGTGSTYAESKAMYRMIGQTFIND
jgi:hypothetical protein